MKAFLSTVLALASVLLPGVKAQNPLGGSNGVIGTDDIDVSQYGIEKSCTNPNSDCNLRVSFFYYFY